MNILHRKLSVILIFEEQSFKMIVNNNLTIGSAFDIFGISDGSIFHHFSLVSMTFNNIFICTGMDTFL